MVVVLGALWSMAGVLTGMEDGVHPDPLDFISQNVSTEWF